MEGRKLLDAHVINGRQEIAKPIVTSTVAPWIFEIFVSLDYFVHTWSQKAYCLTSFCRKKDSQLRRKEETSAMKEERELFFVCYILDIH